VTAPALTRYETTAEQRALGIFMLRPDLALRSGITVSDMDAAKGHDLILTSLLEQADRGVPGSFQMLAADLAARGHLRRCGDGSRSEQAYLFALRELGQTAVMPSDLDVARKQIKEATLYRRVAELSMRLAQATGQPDPEVMLENVAELTMGLQLAVDDNGIDGDRPLPGLRSVAELLAMPDEGRRWIVPGLLARQERTLLIAGEGMGKSVLSRQLGACVAAGVHPFLPRAPRYTPSRVLLVDLENPPSIVRRNMEHHVHAVGGLDAIGDRYHVWNWPMGLDVRSPAGRSMLIRAIEQTRPDLLVIGPLYKMAESRSSETYEEQAAKTAAALDALRQRYDLSLWIEHHMPKAQDGRRSSPFGASLWMRWPEFGLRLEQPVAGEQEDNTYTLGRFRGDRETRHWPDALVRGAGRLQWAGMYDDAEVEAEIYRACEQSHA
jgi:hypothetical protein